MVSTAMNLVIVESPAKVKTIKKYLGKEFVVLASYGHVRDLIPKEGAVEPELGFKMHYQVLEKNQRHVQAIFQRIQDVECLYLATDPDREGEAIAWHLCELLDSQNLLTNKLVHRIAFHEITQRAVQEAVANPRKLSTALVNAQQARRALDYLVGFNLSPLLWKKIRQGLSAGRVQSPALRLIVEREQAIQAFVIQEYWTVEANAAKKNQSFDAKLIQFQSARLEQFSITTEAQAAQIKAELLNSAAEKLLVEKVERKQRKRQPAAPFTTSTLQQEAARKLGLTTQRTMRIAQQLYEGIDIGGETVGLITYMRTDSVALSQDAVTEIRDFIMQRYGAEQLPKTPRTYKTKAKNAQEAHEAIRPTSILRLPADLVQHLSKDQLKLYELIWKRTLACQMQNAIINIVAVDLSAGIGNIFHATGSTIADAGFMQVYSEGQDDTPNVDVETESKALPPLVVGEEVDLNAILNVQHFTEPPPRYTEASLVRSLEELGIGRPSTYASIISTLQEREYVRLEEKRFFPTDVGQIVNKFLAQYFTQYVDYDFTARLEDDLDAVARGDKDWLPLLEQFWQPFKAKIQQTDIAVKRSDITHEAIDEVCPKCGQPLSVRLGKLGRFIGCTTYPKCDYTRNLKGDTVAISEPIDRNCPKCNAILVIKTGRYGRFIGCSGYPVCKHMEPLDKPQDTGVTCPTCKQGQMLQRKSRYGKLFYACSTYPKCKYAVNNPPFTATCPQCGWSILTTRTKRNGDLEQVCPQKSCNFKSSVVE